MRRHRGARIATLLGAALLGAAALGACSGSSSSRSAKTSSSSTTASALSTTAEIGSTTTSTADTGGSTSTSGGATATTGAPGGPPVSHVAPPPNACLLLTPVQVFQVLGTTRDSTLSQVGPTATCTFHGANGRMTLAVERVADTGAAHGLVVQAAKAASTAARGVFGVGEEAVEYPGGLRFRSGTLVVTITVSPAPSSTALETAARNTLGQL